MSTPTLEEIAATLTRETPVVCRVAYNAGFPPRARRGLFPGRWRGRTGVMERRGIPRYPW